MTGTFGNPNASKPAFQKEYVYASVAAFSGNGVTLSAVGASAIYDALVAVPNHSYIVYGWQCVFVCSGSGSHKGHIAMKMSSTDGVCKGLLHASDDQNSVVMLPQPIMFDESSEIIYTVIDASLAADDYIFSNLFYGLVRTS